MLCCIIIWILCCIKAWEKVADEEYPKLEERYKKHANQTSSRNRPLFSEIQWVKSSFTLEFSTQTTLAALGSPITRHYNWFYSSTCPLLAQFHSELKTFLFDQSFPPYSLFAPTHVGSRIFIQFAKWGNRYYIRTVFNINWQNYYCICVSQYSYHVLATGEVNWSVHSNCVYHYWNIIVYKPRLCIAIFLQCVSCDLTRWKLPQMSSEFLKNST